MTDTGKLIRFGDVAAMEPVINEYAKDAARKHRINPDHFTVHLVSKLDRGYMEVVRGNPVQIVMVWPGISSILNMELDSAFRLMKRLPLYDSWAIVSMAYVHESEAENRKFYKTVFGDIGEIIPDLLPRTRLRVTYDQKVTITDVKTGESISVEHKGKPDRFTGNEVGLWLQLSRIVKEHHREPVELETPAANDTNMQSENVS